MTFMKGAFMGPAFGLVDGKPGAASNLGPSVGGAAFGATAQRMIDGPNRPVGQGYKDPYYRPQDTASTGAMRSGRGSTSLSV